MDEEAYVFILGRVDDVINVAGYRLSTGEMEEVVSTHKDAAGCAVIGAHDQRKGQLPVGLVVLKSGVERDQASMVRDTIEPIACYKETCVVKRLPKTRPGRIPRSTMRKIADGEACFPSATIDDPVIPEEIAEARHAVGYPRQK